MNGVGITTTTRPPRQAVRSRPVGSDARARFRMHLATAVVAGCLGLSLFGVTGASATWFNWYNGVVGAKTTRFEGHQHNTYGTENLQTGPYACTGVTFQYYICSGGASNSMTIRGYALGEPDGGNDDNVSHYDHLWWCNGSC